MGRVTEDTLLKLTWCPSLLLIYYLCCWPCEGESDTSSEKRPRRLVLTHESGAGRRSIDFFSRRIGSSAVSLHLPSTSGHKKQPLSAHRSHEEIGSRRKSHPESNEDPTRYHSAPSVIDEVIHRRDWERSTKDLHIPLKPYCDHHSDSSGSPGKPPHAESESSSIEEEHRTDEQIVGNKTCKKHYANIKSSRRKEEKEKSSDDVKDSDATEISNFYIGDSNEEKAVLKNTVEDIKDVQTKSIYKAKEAKQSFNESVRSKDRPKQTLVPLEEHQPRMFGFCLDDVIDQLESLDRSGAMHHSIESRISMSTLSRSAFPPPSVEAVGYEGGACYLAEVGSMSELRARAGGVEGSGEGIVREVGKVATGGVMSMRARHASDGDILAPPQRPESGAFSESDLDLDVEAGEERPPAYDELQHYVASDRKETAI